MKRRECAELVVGGTVRDRDRSGSYGDLACRLGGATASGGTRHPGIDDRQARSLEVGHVAGDDAGAPHARDGSQHQIDGSGGSPGFPPGGEHLRIGCSRRSVEGQDPPVEVIGEHGAGGFAQLGAAATGGQNGDAGQDFRLADRGREQRLRRLAEKCRGSASVGTGRFAARFAWRQFEIDPTQRCEPCAHAVVQVTRGPRVVWCQSCFENAAGFGFHGMSVLRRTDAQALLDGTIKVPDRDRCRAFASLHRQSSSMMSSMSNRGRSPDGPPNDRTFDVWRDRAAERIDGPRHAS